MRAVDPAGNTDATPASYTWDIDGHGWIVDGRTRETVWEMRYRNTEHAGGAEKNRSVQEVLAFAAGSYIVHFVTDGSHAYRHWNQAQPFEPERWGITIVSLDPGFSSDHVAAYDPDDDPATSEGIYVFTSNAPQVEVGDEVHVNGRVTEYRPDEDVRLFSVEIDRDFRKKIGEVKPSDHAPVIADLD